MTDSYYSANTIFILVWHETEFACIDARRKQVKSLAKLPASLFKGPSHTPSFAETINFNLASDKNKKFESTFWNSNYYVPILI